MTEHTVRLRKRSGGATLTYEGTRYSWPESGSVTEVPYGLAVILLGIKDGDYSVEGEAAPARGIEDVAPASVRSASDSGLKGSEEGAGDGEGEGREVTEPAPRGEREVTEPALKAGVHEGSKAPESGDGSKITPKPTAGTRRATTPARRGTAAKK